MAAAGGTGFLKIYRHSTEVRKIFEYPASVLRNISSPVDAIDENIISLSRQMISTLRYFSLIGFFSNAFMCRGLAAPQVGIAKQLIVCGLYGEIRVLVNPKVIETRGGLFRL